MVKDGKERCVDVEREEVRDDRRRWGPLVRGEVGSCRERKLREDMVFFDSRTEFPKSEVTTCYWVGLVRTWRAIQL
jgi:hypothetical protein